MNVVAAVFREFENSVARGGDRYVRPRRPAEAADRLVDVTAAPGWTTKRLQRRNPKTPRRRIKPPDCPGGGSNS